MDSVGIFVKKNKFCWYMCIFFRNIKAHKHIKVKTITIKWKTLKLFMMKTYDLYP